MNEQFSAVRLGRLLWTDYTSRYSVTAMISAALAVLMIASRVFANPEVDVYPFWVLVLLFGWGPVAASASFKELHDKTKNDAYLLLPASALEKVLSRLLLATVGLAAWIFLFSTVVSWIGAAVQRVLVGGPIAAPQALGVFSGFILGSFLVNQSIYFLGAAWFRKSHFVKTALVLTFGPLLLLGVAAFLVATIFPDLSVGIGSFDPNPDVDFVSFYVNHAGTIDALLLAGKVFFFAVIPTFCSWVAWLRVKETQVSHGI